MNKLNKSTPFCKEFDHEDAPNPNLFWVMDTKSELITHSLSLAAIEFICKSRGLTYRVLEVTETACDQVPAGSPEIIQVINADGSVDETFEIWRQHIDLLSEYSNKMNGLDEEEILLKFDTTDMLSFVKEVV